MGKLYFHYSTMNAGKSTLLLQAAHNYGERGMTVLLMTAKLHDAHGEGHGKIASRIGLSEKAATFDAETDLYAYIRDTMHRSPIQALFVDEAQFLTKEQVRAIKATFPMCDTPPTNPSFPSIPADAFVGVGLAAGACGGRF
tara:strand:- start:313 stop:735 length:423 start_codon:yes stop_codon:yes gene_type:complete